MFTVGKLLCIHCRLMRTSCERESAPSCHKHGIFTFEWMAFLASARSDRSRLCRRHAYNVFAVCSRDTAHSVLGICECKELEERDRWGGTLIIWRHARGTLSNSKGISENQPIHFSILSFVLPSFSASPCPSFSSLGGRPFESTNGSASWRHWNVNEPSACSRRSESSGLFIELPEPRAWPGGVGEHKNHTAGAGPRLRACVPKSAKEKGWVGCVRGACWKRGVLPKFGSDRLVE